MRVEPRRHLLLHQEREVERALDLLHEARVDREVRLAVDVQRVVDHRDHRHAGRLRMPSRPHERHWLSNTTSKRWRALQLAPAQQQAQRRRSASRGRRRSARRRAPRGERLESSRTGVSRAPTRACGKPNTFCVRDLVQRDAGVERGQRRPRDHVHVVAGALPLAREVGGVDALAAAVHVAAIGEQRDAHGERSATAKRSEVWRRRGLRPARRRDRPPRARPGRSRSSSRPRR